jgi:6-pyruvoyltetrahydropterin/6-carboxytetrahydropterin synthase
MDSDSSCKPGTGQCAKTHGYSRSVHFEFSATEVDDYGWVVGFSSLKPVKAWLEWLFDHTSLWEAGDPRLQQVLEFNKSLDIPIYNIRALPSGVSMEQSVLFIAMHLQNYILTTTNERCWISRLEVRENDKNSGIIEFSNADAMQLQRYAQKNELEYFPTQEVYEYIAPRNLIDKIRKA